MKREIYLSIAIFGVAGAISCGGAQEGEVTIRTLDNNDLSRLEPGRNLTLDLYESGRGVLFDHSAGEIDYQRITLICPNGVRMNMAEWLAWELPATNQPMARQPNIYLGQLRPSTLKGCFEECHRCEDGILICTDNCSDNTRIPTPVDRYRRDHEGEVVEPRPPKPGPQPGTNDEGGGTGPDNGDPSSGGRPSGEGSGSTGGSGSSGSGGSSGQPPGGGGHSGGSSGGTGGSGGGRGL